VNPAEVIKDLALHAPVNIRLLCPRRDLIANLTLSVMDGHLTMRRARPVKDLHRKRLQGKPAFYANLHVSADRNTVLECGNPRCRYRGYRNEMDLALDLARAALAVHAEHRLTS
jgi:hypothetical protein